LTWDQISDIIYIEIERGDDDKDKLIMKEMKNSRERARLGTLSISDLR